MTTAQETRRLQLEAASNVFLKARTALEHLASVAGEKASADYCAAEIERAEALLKVTRGTFTKESR